MSTGVTKIKQLFVGHLNRLHCAKAHLVERLVDICDEPMFEGVKSHIEKALAQTEQDINSLDRIYDLLDTEYTFEDCQGLVALLEDTFSSFQASIKCPDISFVLILSYLYRVNYIENAEKEILHLLAPQLENPEVTTLLIEATDDKEGVLIEKLTTVYKAFLHGMNLSSL